MRLYHGTADYNLKQFLMESPQKVPRPYLKFRKAFSTSYRFDEAMLFALRKTPIGNLEKTGVVLEFEFDDVVEEKDFIYAGNNILRNEFEVAVFSIEKLKLIAFWKYESELWRRHKLCV